MALGVDDLKFLINHELERIDFDSLIFEGEIDSKDKDASDRSWDSISLVCGLLNELYKYRPLPF